MYLSNGFLPDFQFQMKIDPILWDWSGTASEIHQLECVLVYLTCLYVCLTEIQVFGKSVDLTSF